MRKTSLALAAVSALLGAPALLHAQSFTFTTLDNPGDPTFNQLLGINDHGTIVGYFGSGQAGHPNIGYEIAAPYRKFTPNMQPGSVQTQATGINNEDMTTGFWSDTNTGTDANFAFLRDPTGKAFTYISAIDAQTASTPRVSQALGVNNKNLLVGFYEDANGAPHGYTYALATGVYTDLKIKGAVSSSANAVNDNGEIAGSYTDQGQKTVGFVQNASGGVTASFSIPGSSNTQLLGINNAGTAVGFYLDANGVPHGVYYSSTTGTWLKVNDPSGINGTVLNGINNKGQIVGFYTDAANNTHGMLITVTK